jgi:hypothetical protein
MEAVKIYLDKYFSVPVKDYPIVPFGVFAQFAYAFVVILRAFTIQLEGWNASALGDFIDFPAIMDSASQRYDAVSRVRIDGQELKTEAFSKLATKIRWVKALHDTRLRSTEPEPHGLSTIQEDHDAHPTTTMQPLSNPTAVDVEASLDTFINFEDFWNEFHDPSHSLAEFDPTFEGF